MSEKIKYLYDSKQIADILSEGFAKICKQKPKFPINYLARHLKNHTLKNNEKVNLIDKLQHNQHILQQVKVAEKKLKEELDAKLEKEKVKKMDKNNFLHKIETSERHQEVLDYFCEWINDRLRTTGVYIGELQHQVKKINTLEEDGEEAHLELEKQKIIKFKYSSDLQKKIVVGKTLTQQSVVGKLLNQAQNEGNAPEQQAGEGQQENKPAKSKGQVYIPSVVGSQQLKFFRFPKLGAYFAVSVSVKCYLREKLFDENTVKVESYSKIFHDFQKQMQEKQAKFKQMYDERVNAGAQQKELQDLQNDFQKEKSEIQKPNEEELNFYERRFVVCVDTLGLDREIHETEKEQIRSYIDHLKKNWQAKQKQQLTDDIHRQLALLNPPHEEGHEAQNPNYTEQYNTLLEEEEKQVTAHQQVQKVKDNQKLLQLQSNTVRIQKTRQYLAEDKYLHLFDHLLDFNVIKYNTIIKQFLILLGHKKDEFCFKGTNLLDWQKTKQLFINNRSKIFQNLASMHPRGSKPEFVPAYGKCARIQKSLEGLEPAAVASYNIYLSFILRFLQLYTKIRVQDRQTRLAKIQAEKQNRQLKIKQAQQKAVQKKEKLDALKAELQEKGQLQSFDQQSWNNQYDQQNAPIQIPEETPQDIDRDLEDVPLEQVKEGNASK